MDNLNKEIFSTENYSFLANGGEMGKLIREKNWSKTLVGNPATWPQSLRTTLSIILNSKFPMFLFWGSESVCFYNDAYRPSLGQSGKHPDILGSRGKHYWQEIWPVIKPLIDNILAGGEATWSEDQLLPIYRNGKMEDVYWTFSYSPVHDESGKPAGVFVTCSETTDKVVTLKKIGESEEQFRTLAENIPNLAWMADVNGWIYWYNKKWYEYTGTTQEQMEGWGWQSVHDPKELPQVLDKWKASIASGQTFEMVFPLKGADGNFRQFLTRILPVRSTKGEIVHWFGTNTDITEQKEREATLKESEERFRTMAEGTDILIAVGDESSNAVYFNKEWVNITGRPMDHLLNFGWADLIHQEDRDNYVNLYLEAFEKKESFTGEFRVLNKEGGYSYLLVKGSPRFGSNQKFEGYISSAIDITQRKEIEEALKISEQEFRQLANSLPELIWTTDSNGQQLFASNKWKEFTGIDPEDAASFEKVIHPHDLPGLISVWTDCLQTGKTYKTETRLKSKAGNYHWFYVHGEPLLDENGNIEKWTGAFVDINEQKKNEQELTIALLQVEESEKRFRNLADNAPVLIWTSGTDTLCNFFNKAWLDFTGRNMEQELGNGWAEGVHPEDFKRCLSIYITSFEKKEEFYMEYRLKRDDGEYRWISDKGVPRFTTVGQFEGYIGACMDIHERVVYQKKLKEDEERLNIIINASELGTWELNLKTKAIHYSDRYLKILGYKYWVELTHEQILKHLHTDDLAIRDAAFKKAAETGMLQYESRVIWNDKSIHWIEGKGKVFYNDNNEPHHLIGTIRDITEEKYYQQELQDREQKFRLLADSMPQLVWTGSADGELNYFNQSVYTYSGITPAQMIKEGWIQIVHPDDREENIEKWVRAVNTGEDFLFEHRFRRHDGVFRWQLSRAIPQKDAEGNIQMWVGTSTDIQDMKEQDQQKDFFISMASHELKTPLTSIKGYVQVLKSMHANSEDTILKKALTTIDKQIITLTDLISAMLDLSKIKTGSLSLNKETFQLSDLILEKIEEIQHINSAYKILFSEKYTALVHADRNRIGQVLINFLTNAVKYSPQSGEIKVTTDYKDGEVMVSVIDSGIGINAADQKKIFQRFYRVEGKNEKTFPGFGIGLFIAADIIQKHEGKIGVSSEPGKGSVFYFSIPAIK